MSHIQYGDHLKLNANLKKPRNYWNPGYFDYESWLRSRHIAWIGTIKSKSVIKLKAHLRVLPFWAWYRSRLSNVQNLLRISDKNLGVIQALTIGVTNHIDPKPMGSVSTYRDNHLIDISGEHIALLTSLSYHISKKLWCYAGRIILYIPAQKLAAFLAVVIGMLYALISGFAIPLKEL